MFLRHTSTVVLRRFRFFFKKLSISAHSMFALIRTFTELSGAAPDGSCMTIDGTTHPTQRRLLTVE